MSWIQTYTSKQFYPLNPNINDICIEDIAHALSNICRFTGHCNRFYSVAEHSVIMSYYVPCFHELEALLHDASEAYLCDIAAPVKDMIPTYIHYEYTLQFLIYEKYKIKKTDEIKIFDCIMLQTEKEQLMNKPPADWKHNYDSLNHKIECWFPEKAEFEFLKRFKELNGI